MRAYDNNNYYGYNNNSMTPSSSSNESQISHGGGGSGGGGQEYLSNVSTTPQSSDAEINYHTSTKLKRPRSDKNLRVSSGSFTIIGSNNNHDDEVQNDSTSYGAKINLQIPTIDTTTPTPQFRIQQAKRSHRKNTSFSIMTELPPTSRTPSPPALSTSGRVSPFRGRGFRPGASSRHTTPSSSPPPPLLPSDSSNNNNITGGMNVQPYYEDRATIRNINYINSSGNDSKQDSSIYRQQSRIPRTNRIDNRKQNEIQDKSLLHTNQFNNAFMNQGVTNSTLNNNSLSRSLSNLPVKPGISRPPPSPRRNGAKQAFTQLSPIIGTPKMSPDTTSPPTKSILKPSKSAFVLLSKDETSSEDSKTKSPSKIPRSTSLNRLSQSIESLSKEPALRENSRNSTIKTSQSRLQSRETSPNSKPPTGPRRTVSKNIPKQTTSTAKSTNISRTSSMKNLSKPNSRAPSRSTSPSNMQTASGSSPNKLNRLAPKPVNRGTSRSRSPSTNPTSRSSSPNKSRKPTTKTTASRGSNSLHPSRSTSPAVNRATNSTSRGPSPNRLAVPRERTVNRSRDSSPNKNKKPTPKSPTRIPMKSNNNYRNVISKIDSNNKRATNNVTNKPKIPPKPSIDSDNNHKSKTRESRLSRQISKKLISIPGENVTNSETKTSSEAQKNDQAHVSKDNQNNPTTSEDNETETPNNNESEDDETRPTPTLATLIAQNFDANANNVVSVTTETATAPLHIDAPKPQIPVAPIENLLSKTVAEKPSIGDVKQSSSSNVLSNSQNKQKNDKTVSSTQEEGSKSPPKPMKNQSNPANMPDTATGSAPASDRLKQSVDKQNETNVASSNKESNQNIKEESKILTKKNSEKKIDTSNVNNNNTTVITHSNSVDKNSLSNITNSLQTANNNTKNLPIIVSDKVKPIQIQVKERGTNLDVQSGNIERRPSNGTIAGKGEPRILSALSLHFLFIDLFHSHSECLAAYDF
ncbi:putative uncharacterized protein DDB_G0277255 [Chrysoperla carnea]|uniref:putative uncharacterized protein DDB_G0277255 n=1 Tax=Chrysoperla carnea TaxID=189513 RepID=UPI001D07CB4D|nr:putative uncharacterized protein DDB_G0277255 [Chrysoperla carnea]